MLNQVTARLRKFIGKAREGHGLHAPFRVTTHRGHAIRLPANQVLQGRIGYLLKRPAAEAAARASMRRPMVMHSRAPEVGLGFLPGSNLTLPVA